MQEKLRILGQNAIVEMSEHQTWKGDMMPTKSPLTLVALLCHGAEWATRVGGQIRAYLALSQGPSLNMKNMKMCWFLSWMKANGNQQEWPRLSDFQPLLISFAEVYNLLIVTMQCLVFFLDKIVKENCFKLHFWIQPLHYSCFSTKSVMKLQIPF